MISYDQIIGTVNDCAEKLHNVGDSRSLNELRQKYKEAIDKAEDEGEYLKIAAHLDDLIWVNEFYESYSNKTKTEIEFELDQNYFEKYVEYVKQALARL